MTSTTTTPGHPPADPAKSWWLATGTLVIGLFLGALIVGLLSTGSTTPPGSPGAAALGPPVVTASTGTAPAGSSDMNITVNDACLRAVNAAQDAYTALTDIGGAAKQLNAAQLDEIVRRLQPLQKSLQANLTACRVTTPSPRGSLSSTELPEIPTTSITPTTTAPSSPTS
ncbi:MAG TPA: hypothetical protein VIJ23_06445 [Mycobacterium sp.]